MRKHCSDNQRLSGPRMPCGGAIPHQRDSECGMCPRDPSAICVVVEEITVNCPNCNREYRIAKGDHWMFCEVPACGWRIKG